METNAILILATLTVLIIFSFLYLISTRKQGKNRKQKLVTDIARIDDERKRIMSDLHDELGPLLSVVKMQVMHLQARIETDAEHVKEIVQNLDHLMHRMRVICNQLVPDTTIKKDFRETIAGFISDVRNHSGIQVYLVTDQQLLLPGTLQIQLYRVIQEIVNNTIKHANSTVLTISIRVQAQKNLHISIADNGRGFHVEEVKTCCKAGMGMRNIFTRISMLNGTVFIDTMPGEGTKYIITIPLQNCSVVKAPGNRTAGSVHP